MNHRFLTRHHLILGTVILVGFIPPLQAADPVSAPPANASPQSAARFQTVKRQELLFTANQAVSDGDRLAQAGKFDQAADRYQFVLDSLINGGGEEPVYARAQSGLAAVKLTQAEIAGKNAKFDTAIVLIKQSIILEPQDPTYPQALKDMEDAQAAYIQQGQSPESLVNNPAVTQEFTNKVAAVQKLLFQGDRYFETGQYDQAKASYSKILLLDPTSKIARQKMAHIDGYLARADGFRRDEYKQEKMEQVDHEWSEQISPDIVSSQNNDNKTSEISNRAVITRKLQSIVLDKVNFEKLDITQVVKFLHEKSKELDPEKQGVNFVLRLTSNSAPPAVAPGAPAVAPAAATPNPAAPPQPTINRAVSITLENVPLSEVLEYIQQQTNLQFSVDDYAVYLRPSVEEGEYLTVRTFLAPPSLFANSNLTASGGNGAPNTVASSTLDVQKELENKGIVFPDGASATFLPGSSKLVVRNTPEQLDLISNVIDSLSKEVPQVEIEAKVAEFTEQALKEFAFNYQLGYTSAITPGKAATNLRDADYVSNGGIGGLSNDSVDALLIQNASGTATPPVNGITGQTVTVNDPNVFKIGAVIDGHGLLAVIEALNNVHGADLLVAPSVTVQNGQKASINIAQQFYFPKNFDPPKLSNQENLAINIDFNAGTAVPVALAIPPTPRDFGEVDLGVNLEVKPTAMDQRIDLDLTQAEAIDFDGFINYGQGIVQRSTDADPAAEGATISPGVINQPVFEDRSVSTKLQVLDGQTAVLGGLVREDTQEVNDKVPLLGDLPLIGRLFQSKVSQRTKKNLIFFITARLIRSNGKPQYVQTLSADSGGAPSSGDKSVPANLMTTPATTTGNTSAATVDAGPLNLPQ